MTPAAISWWSSFRAKAGWRRDSGIRAQQPPAVNRRNPVALPARSARGRAGWACEINPRGRVRPDLARPRPRSGSRHDRCRPPACVGCAPATGVSRAPGARVGEDHPTHRDSWAGADLVDPEPGWSRACGSLPDRPTDWSEYAWHPASASQLPWLARTARGATTKRTRASGILRIAWSSANTADGAERTRCTGRPGSDSLRSVRRYPAPRRRAVAQLVEHRSPKPGVGGSSPSGPVTNSG